MPTRTVKVRLTVEEQEAFKKALQGAGAEGEAALRKIERASTPASKGLQAVNKASQEGKVAIEAYAGQMGTFGRVLASIGPVGLGVAAGLGAAVLGIKKLFDLGRDAAEFGDQFEKMSRRTGVAVEQLSALKFAAERSGAEFDTLEKGIQRMTRNALEASQGTGEAAKAFQHLGVSVTGSNGQLRPAYDLLLDLSDALKALPSDSEKAALAQVLFGRSGADLLPLLGEGAAGIRALSAEAQRLGAVISTEDAQKAAELEDRLTDLNTAFKALKLEIGFGMIPALDDLATKMTETFTDEDVRQGVRNMTDLVAGLTSGVGALGAVFLKSEAQVERFDAKVTQWLDSLLGTDITGWVHPGAVPSSNVSDMRQFTIRNGAAAMPETAVTALNGMRPSAPVGESNWLQATPIPEKDWERQRSTWVSEQTDAALKEYAAEIDRVVKAAGEAAKKLESLGATKRDRTLLQGGGDAKGAVGAEGDQVAKLADARERESQTLAKAQTQQLAYERVMRSGFDVLSQAAPEWQGFFSSAANFFSGDMLGGTLSLIGAIAGKMDLLRDKAKEFREETEKLEAARRGTTKSAEDRAAALFQGIDPEGFSAKMEGALGPLRQAFTDFKVGKEWMSQIDLIRSFLADVGRVGKSFGDTTLKKSELGGVSQALADLTGGMDVAAFNQWRADLSTVFGGSGTFADAAEQMFEMAAATDDFTGAAGKMVAVMGPLERSVRAQFDAREIAARTQFQQAYRAAGADPYQQAAAYEQLKSTLEAMSSAEQVAMQQLRSAGIVTGSGTSAAKVAAGDTGSGAAGGAVSISPTVTITATTVTVSDLIHLPSADDIMEAIGTGKDSLGAHLTAALSAGLTHFLENVNALQIVSSRDKTAGGDAALGTPLAVGHFVQLPSADDFMTTLGTGAGALGPNLSAATLAGLDHFWKALAGIRIRPQGGAGPANMAPTFGGTDIWPHHFIELPEAAAFGVLATGAGGLGPNLSAMAQAGLDHFWKALEQKRIRPAPAQPANQAPTKTGGTDIWPQHFIELPKSADFLALATGAGGLGPSLSAMSQAGLDHFWGALASIRIRPAPAQPANQAAVKVGGTDIWPHHFIELPREDQWKAYGGVLAGRLSMMTQVGLSGYLGGLSPTPVSVDRLLSVAGKLSLSDLVDTSNPISVSIRPSGGKIDVLDLINMGSLNAAIDARIDARDSSRITRSDMLSKVAQGYAG